LVQEVAGEEADAALGEGRRRREGARSAGGGEGVEVAQPGGESEPGGGIPMATAGEALEVASEEGDLGQREGEGANLLGAQAVLQGVEVALGGAGAGPFAASPAGGQVSGHGGLLSVCQRIGNGLTDWVDVCGLKPAAADL